MNTPKKWIKVVQSRDTGEWFSVTLNTRRSKLYHVTWFEHVILVTDSLAAVRRLLPTFVPPPNS